MGPKQEIVLDGSAGEGGGQVLRSALGLSLVTGRPFRIDKIRANRKKPGLMRQHLTCVKAAQAVGGAVVDGAELNSTGLSFRPQTIISGFHKFVIGSAGSTTLVLQTILPALLSAPGPTRVVIQGGTHNQLAPSFDFLDRVFAPILRGMGVGLDLTLQSHGFFPAGGGSIQVVVTPTKALRPFEFLTRGPIIERRGRILVSKIPARVAEREREVLEASRDWRTGEIEILRVTDSPGPGNLVSLEVGDGRIRELVTRHGARGVRAETVAKRALDAVESYLSCPAPVGENLADQMLIPLALAGAGAFRCGMPSLHALTNADVIQQFLSKRFEFSEAGDGTTVISV
ncbi:MAG: RNA 3'-terminal phosphate cyclase [Planctomycetota bacterium]